MTAVETTWEEAMSERFGGLLPGEGRVETAKVTGSLWSADLGRLGIFDIRGTPQTLRRTSVSVRNAPIDLVKICMVRRGTCIVHQGDTEVRLGPGEMALYDTARPYDLLLAGDWQCTVMTVPRTALTLPWNVVSQGMTRSISARRGPASVLMHLIDEGIRASSEDFAPSVLNSLGSEAGLRLLEGALNAPVREALAVGSTEELDQSRSMIRSWIVDHARMPGLSHDDVARAHHMSSRSLHRLFEDEADSATQLIRESRLAGVHAELADPYYDHHSVMEVASRWGFTDQAHFTRVFRAAFDRTPGTHRRESRHHD